VNSNADNVELFLNGKSLGKKVMVKNSHLIWKVAYQPGTLQAIAYKNGRKITNKVETTGEAYQLILKTDRTSMKANGTDAAVINVTVVEKKGREVPDANNLISFSFTGDAKIMGVGNGDPSSHEKDKCEDGNWQRKLFNGKCQLIIQTGTGKSAINIIAKSDGIKSGVQSISATP